MPTYEEEPVRERRVVRESESPRENLTSYAFVKYAFMLAITIVILYFLATYIIPRF
ncbi:MAG: hypothetical protein KY393_05475 [Actinobacteria bacterium]|nr:hypothetical protein [Actinomycetota bacterium]